MQLYTYANPNANCDANADIDDADPDVGTGADANADINTNINTKAQHEQSKKRENANEIENATNQRSEESAMQQPLTLGTPFSSAAKEAQLRTPTPHDDDMSYRRPYDGNPSGEN
ncbi:hypothetical protein L484_027319 [Morus notabilis]|uniref:Uncharacterized protein n=1 Tax=Morus notabilis TaxID=981085 RepID=W9QJT9_9ROSA|nr:hypothetical protein L484_027319 [Morus notabilis]